ncbi:MAG: MFS transporter [Alphaproteobacteria bacterium]|nr:MAG: MFS transporter [Alphaproteobacteria bacterium]
MLFMLVLVYTFNFIDRQIIGILAVPIKEDLGLSDTQLGLMGGLAFALFYTSLGIPIAWLADRKSRTWIMTISLVVWSGMTAVCGLVQNFTQLFLARLGVGVGEAGGVAPAYSLIADFFPQSQRARALSIYSFGIPIGSALGIAFGGYMASKVDWRVAFFVVGIAGILIAPVFRMLVKEPKRGQFDGALASEDKPGVIEVVKALVSKPGFWLLSFGAGCSSMMGYGLFFWLPSLFVRSFNLTILEASTTFGAILLVGGVIGIWGGGWLADRSARSGKKAGYARIPAIAFILTIPFYMAGIMAPSFELAMVVMLVPTALGLMWLGPVLAAVQHLVPPNMRSTASAIFLFINNLTGIGLGTVIIGAISDALKASYGDESLRYSILVGTAFYVAAAALLYLASRTLDRDWVSADERG